MARSEHDQRLAILRNDAAPYFERRDAAIVLAPIFRERLLPDLERLYAAEEPRARQGAIAALEHIGDAGRNLLRRALSDTDPRVREIAGGLWLARYAKDEPAPLLALSADPIWLVRRHAVRLQQRQAEASAAPGERVRAIPQMIAVSQPARVGESDRKQEKPPERPRRTPAPPKPTPPKSQPSARPVPPPPAKPAPAVELARPVPPRPQNAHPAIEREEPEFEQIGKVRAQRGRPTNVRVAQVAPAEQAKQGGCGKAIGSGCAVMFWVFVAYQVLSVLFE